MQVFEENLMLKEKIREFEVDDINCTEFNIREKINHNLLFLTEVSNKIEESIKHRKVMEKKLERIVYLSGQTPDEISKENFSEESMANMNNKLENINFELLKVKQTNEELESQNSSLKKKIDEKSYEMMRLDEDRENTIMNYEKRIKEIKESIDYNSGGMHSSKEVDELQKELVETKDQCEVLKKSCEDYENQIRYSRNQYDISIKQKEDVLDLTQTIVKTLKEDNNKLAVRNQSLENRVKILTEETESWDEKKRTLKEKIATLMKEQVNYENNLEKTLREKYELQNEIKSFKEKNIGDKERENFNDIINKLNNDAQREKIEKEKIQEELEILQDSYSFVLQEMSNLNKLNREGKLSEMKEGNPENKKKVKNIVSGVQTTLEIERQETQKLRDEIKELTLKIKELNAEENNLRVAFESSKEKSLKSIQRVSEVESLLSEQKKNYDELTLRLANTSEELNASKQEIMETRLVLQKMENMEIKFKDKRREDQEKIVSLQEQLSEKMDEFHNLHGEFQAIEHSVLNSNKLLNDKDKIIEDAKKELKIVKSAKSDLETEVFRVKDELEKLINDNGKKSRSKKFTIDEQTATINDLNLQLLDKESRLVQVAQEYSNYLNEHDGIIAELTEKLSKLEELNQDLEKQTSVKKIEIQGLKSDLRVVTHQLSTSHAQIEQKDDENKKLQEKIEQLEAEVSRLKIEKLKANTKEAEVEDRVESSEGKRSIEMIESKNSSSVTAELQKEVSLLKEEK